MTFSGVHELPETRRVLCICQANSAAPQDNATSDPSAIVGAACHKSGATAPATTAFPELCANAIPDDAMPRR